MATRIGWMTRAASLLATIVVVPASVAAQGTPARLASASPADTSPRMSPLSYRYRLLGVFDDDTGIPIDGVEVMDMMSGTSVRTEASGVISLFFLPDGGSLVRLRKLGYATQTFVVPIQPDDTTPLTVTMAHATELPTVNVVDSAPHYMSPNLRGAEQRMRSGEGGYFIDEKEMRKLENTTMTDAFSSRLPGLVRVLGPHNEEYLASSRRMCGGLALSGCKSPNCYVSVYMDGVLFDQAGGPIDFSKWSTFNFAIAEFYPAGPSMPVQYARSTCGALLLWTRER